jgi:P-type E1-E2 ATPase
LCGLEHTKQGIRVELSSDREPVARFYFTDVLKEGSNDLFRMLAHAGVGIQVITGDSEENAQRVFANSGVIIHASASPEDKYGFVADAHKKGQRVVMVGDGLNDAPALASADVGVVFSGAENGASIEAADIVILDSSLTKLSDLFKTAHRTLGIAKESIYGGILLSAIGMGFAAFGFIPPVMGAVIQEVIDVVVIVNALRTLRA